MREGRILLRRCSTLMRRRAAISAELARIDAVIRDLGESLVKYGVRGQRPVGKGLRDYLATALKDKMMSVAEAANAVEELGYETSASDFRTVVNTALVKKTNGFKRVGRGRYTLAESPRPTTSQPERK